jgi:hypothetical protein
MLFTKVVDPEPGSVQDQDSMTFVDPDPVAIKWR